MPKSFCTKAYLLSVEAGNLIIPLSVPGLVKPLRTPAFILGFGELALIMLYLLAQQSTAATAAAAR